MVKRKQGMKEGLVFVFLNTFDVKRNKGFQTGVNRRLPVLDRMNQPIPKGVISLGTTERQGNNAELFQFEKEAATCHIFVLAIVCFPIPGNAEFPGEFRPMPMGVFVHEALDTLDIRGRDAAPTYCYGYFHDWEYNK